MKKIYRFSFDIQKHADVINAIESVPKTLRTQYIVDVIRFALSKLIEMPVTTWKQDKSENSMDRNNMESFQKQEDRTRIETENKPVNLSKIFEGF